MKPGRLTWLLIAFGAGAMFSLALGVTYFREPSYKGHTLSDWLVAYRSAPSADRDNCEAAQAVRQIGPRAFPWLVGWLRYEEPAWRSYLFRQAHKRRSWQAPRWVLNRVIPCRPDRPDAMALIGFQILGPAAEPAVPQLMRLACDVNATNCAMRATYCLAKIGPAGTSSVLKLLADRKKPGWLRACAARQFSLPGNWDEPVIVGLEAARNDPDREVSNAAAKSLAVILNSEPQAYQDLHKPPTPPNKRASI